MHTYESIFKLGMTICFFTYLRLSAAGFRHSVLWGLFVMLLSPIGATAFAISNWRDGITKWLFLFEVRIKWIFLAYATGLFLILVAGVGYAGIVYKPLMQLHVYAKSHKLTDKEKQYQVEYILRNGRLPPRQESADADSDKTDGSSVVSGVEKTKPVSEPLTRLATAAKVPDVNSATGSRKNGPASPPNINGVPPDPLQQQSTAGNQGDANSATYAPKNEPASPPNINAVPPDPLQQKSISLGPRTITVSLGGISRYLGRYLIITVKGGTQHRGLLRKVEPRKLILERKLYGGKFEYGIRKDKIKSIQMLTYIPDEEE